jgi:HPr kinase/phosphorylase
MVVQLEPWDEAKEYERTGLDEATYDILGVRLPFVTIPISPVRNVPVIIETAAMNQRLKKLGFHAAREFDHRLRKLMAQRIGGDGND